MKLPVWFQYFGYAILAGLPIYLAYFSWCLISRRTRVNVYRLALGALELTYILGLGLKLAMVGPLVLRYHLADLGFPVFVSTLLNGPRIDSMEIYAALRRRHRTLIAGLALSLMYEVATGALYGLFPGQKIAIVGNFDPVDVALYCIGAACGLYTVYLWRRAVIAFDTRQAQALAERQAADATSRAAERRSAEAALRRSRQGQRRRRPRR